MSLALFEVQAEPMGSLKKLYIYARDGVYMGLRVCLLRLYPFPLPAEKDIFICSDVRKSIRMKVS